MIIESPGGGEGQPFVTSLLTTTVQGHQLRLVITVYECLHNMYIGKYTGLELSSSAGVPVGYIDSWCGSYVLRVCVCKCVYMYMYIYIHIYIHACT